MSEGVALIQEDSRKVDFKCGNKMVKKGNSLTLRRIMIMVEKRHHQHNDI